MRLGTSAWYPLAEKKPDVHLRWYLVLDPGITREQDGSSCFIFQWREDLQAFEDEVGEYFTGEELLWAEQPRREFLR